MGSFSSFDALYSWVATRRCISPSRPSATSRRLIKHVFLFPRILALCLFVWSITCVNALITACLHAECLCGERICCQIKCALRCVARYVRASTNGELLEPGVDELLALLRPGADAVFADLGSGAGCALLHVAARVSMRACVGVELVGARHEAALAALDMICSERDNALKTPTTFLKADLCELERFIQVPLADEVHLGDLTHVYLSSVCFDDYLLRTIARTLGSPELCPNIQAAVSLRELPSNPYLTEIGKLPLTCSWNARCIARVYVPTDLLSRRKQPIAVLARFCCAGDNQTGFVCTLPYALQYPQHGRLRLPRQ
mmetsp:Transcript_32277/g.67912  ORF Transcript_32277/g.67912 Transcript_32277/m.67912 type:complete len:316 (+) Transcript_32277:1410-2357(+)